MFFYDEVHSAIEKLKNGEELEESEREELVKVLESLMGKAIPTPEELHDYKYNIELVKKYNEKIPTMPLAEQLYVKLDEYNDKYHPCD